MYSLHIYTCGRFSKRAPSQHRDVMEYIILGTGILVCKVFYRFVVYYVILKQHFDTRYLVFYNTSPPRMFLSLDLLWEYRIQLGANGPLYVTSSYSTWIFCRGVSGFANWLSLRRLVSWINHLLPACWSTFWKSNFKQQLGCRFDIMDN